MKEKEEHIVFTDGSSLGNPGPGGWGAVLVLSGEHVVELGGREAKTTNNRMELSAAINALDRLVDETGDVVIYTDSKYLVNGITQWAKKWVLNDWMTTAKKPVDNRDLWEKLLELEGLRSSGGVIHWKYVPGHVGVPGNERADEIATMYAKDDEPRLYEGDAAEYTIDVLHLVPDEQLTAQKTKQNSRKGKAYSYLSLVDGIPMRHSTWAECESRVKGKSGVKFRKALSVDEEKEILNEWGVKLEK